MNIVISQPMFFPWVGMFEQIRLADTYVHYSDVPFSKGSFVNRVQVKTAQGTPWMTVPLKSFSIGQSICEVEIDDQKDWRRKHREMLAQAYARAPFMEDMLKIVDGVYSRRYDNIDELSKASIRSVCEFLGLDKERRFLDIRDLHIAGSGSQRVLDTVQALEGKSYTTGLGARNYLQHELFEQADIRVNYMDYEKKPYAQLHGDFTPFVSILDLIANTGRESSGYITSGSIYWKDYVDNG